MFKDKEIADLKRRVVDLEGAVRRMQNYLMAEQQEVVSIEFTPDPELMKSIKNKKLN